MLCVFAIRLRVMQCQVANRARFYKLRERTGDLQSHYDHPFTGPLKRYCESPMFILLAVMLLLLSLVLSLFDPFLQSSGVWCGIRLCWAGALVSLGVAVGRLF